MKELNVATGLQNHFRVVTLDAMDAPYLLFFFCTKSSHLISYCYYGSAALSSQYANSNFPPDDKLELAMFCY